MPRNVAFNPDLLEKFLGRWAGPVTTWFQPGTDPMHDQMTGVIERVVEGRSIVHRYDTSVGGKPARGQLMIGRSLETMNVCLAWIDSFHTGGDQMILQGDGKALKNGFSAFGAYAAPQGPPWGWRTTYRAKSADGLEILHYNILPSGEEMLAVKIEYARQAAKKAAAPGTPPRARSRSARRA